MTGGLPLKPTLMVSSSMTGLLLCSFLTQRAKTRNCEIIAYARGTLVPGTEYAPLSLASSQLHSGARRMGKCLTQNVH